MGCVQIPTQINEIRVFKKWHFFLLQSYPLFPPRIELRTFSVLGRRDNHYTMETYQRVLHNHFAQTNRLFERRMLSFSK